MGFGITGTYVASVNQIATTVQTTLEGALTLIEDKNLDAGAAANFDFTSIPYYANYLIFFHGLSATGGQHYYMRFNNDTGNHYRSITSFLAGTYSCVQTLDDAFARLSTNSDGTGASMMLISIANTRAGTSKDWLCHETNDYNGQSVSSGYWSDTSAVISRITIYLSGGANIGQYARCRLYGVS